LYRFVASLLATLRGDSEFDGGLGIKLPSDWQILSLLKFGKARPGSETEHTIDCPSILSFALESLLSLFTIVRMRNCWRLFAGVDSRGQWRRAWSGIPSGQQYENDTSPRSLTD
jgi:hypothetical protein